MFVFDIAYERNPETSSEWVIKVEGKFQQRLNAFDRERMISTGHGWELDSSLDKVVMPSHFVKTSYYLKDISFRHTLMNANALNYGEDNYDNRNDYGEFFTQSIYSYNGVAPKCQSDVKNFAQQTIHFGLGFVGFNNIGNIVSTAQYIHEVGYDLVTGNYVYKNNQIARDNEAGTKDFENVWDQHLNRYGQYLRQISVIPNLGDNRNALLIGVGHNIKSRYKINRRETKDIEQHRIMSLRASICEDNTYKSCGKPVGNIDVIDTKVTGYDYSRIQRSFINVKGNLERTFELENVSYVYDFESKYDESYVFETSGSDVDTFFIYMIFLVIK